MTEQRQPWEQMEGEPDMWFTRFEMYKQLGPNRSLRLLNGLLHGMDGPTDDVNGGLKRASTQWNWHQRVQAWDNQQVRQLSAMEQDRRFAAREERLAIIDALLKAVSRVLVTADIGSMGRYEARAWIPAMRLMLKDLLAAQRVELGIMDGTAQADNSLAASEELVAWSKAQDNMNVAPAADGEPRSPLGNAHEVGTQSHQDPSDEDQDKILSREMYRMLHSLYGEEQGASSQANQGEAKHD